MRKLALKVDDLRVDSFETVEAAEGRGTVAAHAPTEDLNCTAETCPSSQPTCGILPPTYDGACYPAKPGGGGDYSFDGPCCV